MAKTVLLSYFDRFSQTLGSFWVLKRNKPGEVQLQDVYDSNIINKVSLHSEYCSVHFVNVWTALQFIMCITVGFQFVKFQT